MSFVQHVTGALTHASETSATEGEAHMLVHTVRRNGQAPAQFRGELIVEANNYSPIGDMWHEVNIYRRSGDAYVVVVKALKKREDETDIIHVQHLQPADAVIQYLLHYDTRRDIHTDLDANDPDMSLVELTLHAVELRRRCELVRQNWDSMIGELLYGFYAEGTE